MLGAHAWLHLLHLLSIHLHCPHLSVHLPALAASHWSVCCRRPVRRALIDSGQVMNVTFLAKLHLA
jgi:hypothetical protein